MLSILELKKLVLIYVLCVVRCKKWIYIYLYFGVKNYVGTEWGVSKDVSLFYSNNKSNPKIYVA